MSPPQTGRSAKATFSFRRRLAPHYGENELTGGSEAEDGLCTREAQIKLSGPRSSILGPRTASLTDASG